jgi:rubrerythrin
MERSQVEELVYQSLETEAGGVKVYRMALRCVRNADLKKEWQEYLEQTENHERIVRDLCETLGLDPERQTPGRQVVRHKAMSLVGAMEMALRAGDPAAAQLVAAECVVDAETKDHQNWELLGQVAEKLKGAEAAAMRAACEQVEDEEDEHLYHTAGWTRELWIESLGLPAVLPPPEETQDVKTALAAARAKQSRKAAGARAETRQRRRTPETVRVR